MDGSKSADAQIEMDSAEILGPLKREYYFPTQIFFRDFEDKDALNVDLVGKIRKERDTDNEGIERSNVTGLGSWHSGSLQDDPEYAELLARILKTGAAIAAANGYDENRELAIDNMWAIINPRGSFNRSHVHPGALWSGVYYVQAPPKAGKIVFTDPRTENLMIHPYFQSGQKRPTENWTEVYFDPLPGRMLMFPSWLYHSVEPNLTDLEGPDAERIIISFNLFQRRKT